MMEAAIPTGREASWILEIQVAGSISPLSFGSLSATLTQPDSGRAALGAGLGVVTDFISLGGSRSSAPSLAPTIYLDWLKPMRGARRT